MIKDRIRKHLYVDQIQLKGIMERLEMEKDLDVITDMQSFSDFIYEFYQKNQFLTKASRPGMRKK